MKAIPAGKSRFDLCEWLEFARTVPMQFSKVGNLLSRFKTDSTWSSFCILDDDFSHLKIQLIAKQSLPSRLSFVDLCLWLVTLNI